MTANVPKRCSYALRAVLELVSRHPPTPATDPGVWETVTYAYDPVAWKPQRRLSQHISIEWKTKCRVTIIRHGPRFIEIK